MEEQKQVSIKWENPFALKVGQVFTGFGIGCGVGIGVGRPLNLGLAIKPGVLHKLQSCIAEALMRIALKFGVFPGLSSSQNMLPGSLKTTMNAMNGTLQSPMENFFQAASKSPEQTTQGKLLDIIDMESKLEPSTSKRTSSNALVGSRYEHVVSSFLQNPVLKDEDDSEVRKLEGKSVDYLLIQLTYVQEIFNWCPVGLLSWQVLKHQQIIDELIEENEKLRHVLIEEFKVSPNKLQANKTRCIRSISPCSNCFECRRRQKKHK
ncbi:hypothetical protein Sjap_008439 [Stephania japonica]|uniref:Uncharacterized protein n=1 Tax=Stephania japonica TaxID=461633 RepID=A0AAP0PEL6_9MAGN